MGGTMNEAATAPTIAPIIMKTRTIFTTPPRCSVPSYATRGGGKGTPGAAPGGPGVPRPPASETCADTYFSALTVRGSSHGAEGLVKGVTDAAGGPTTTDAILGSPADYIRVGGFADGL